jgi:type IV pilus assembly protein PilW
MKIHRTFFTATRGRVTGFSLIELLVAMVIGLVVTAAIASVLIRTEGSKRTTTSVNDLNQTGAYTAYVLDRHLRSAGSGFSQRWKDVYGCLLDVSQYAGAQQVLPISPALTASSPFFNFTPQVRMAPVIIGKDLASSASRGDVLMVMSGSGGVSEMSLPLLPGSTTSDLNVATGLGFETNDIILLSDPGVTAGCMVQQVGTRTISNAGQTIPLGGATPTYFTEQGSKVNLSGFFAGNAVVSQLGSTKNPPQFKLYGVGDNNTLVSLDLLTFGGAEASIADGVVEMRALYGLDTTDPTDGVIDSWTSATGAYAASTLTDGSEVSRNNLRRIVAVRVGFVLRTSLAEKPNKDGSQVTGSSLTLFEDLGALKHTRTLTTEESNYRYRTFETTIPLRNVLLAPQS